ncbi:MAG: sigma-70 family RNA polymerase sigma factor [Gemmatimonadetes bacterium]|nr:sigma-70 family RNA polymerase sigma factor [Gemmatimonadota bacterium]
MSLDWAEVYRSTFLDLVRFLHRKVWDADRAQELAQEAFVRALSQTGRRPDNPRAWLFRVAANLAKDEARLVIRRKKHLALLKVEAETEPAVEPELLQTDERAAREEAVRQALAQLGERDREALLLWDAGLSYREIAEHTGLALGAIGTTLARARARLVEAYSALEAKHAARG